MAYGPIDTGKPVKRIKFTRESILDNIGADHLSTSTLDDMRTAMLRRREFGSVGAKKSTSARQSGFKASPSSVKKQKIDWNKAFSRVKPYISNIANAFTTVPKPSVPGLTNMVSIPRVNMDNARNMVERSTRAADVAANNSLDENTAAAVRNANLATKIQGLNDVNSKEANINAQIIGQLAQITAGIESGNVAAMNQYRDNITNSAIATQRERSGNLANAVDKSIAIDNERTKGQLELQKAAIMASAYDQSGVYKRYVEGLKEKGVNNPTGINPDGTYSFRTGGQMRKVFGGGGEDPKKSNVFKTQAEVNAANLAAKRFAVSRGLVSGENTFVARKSGDSKPFVRYEGLPLPEGTTMQSLATTVPSGVGIKDIKGHGDSFWYEDPQTGNIVNINPGVVFPKFGVTPEQAMKDIASRNKTATFRRGGFLTRKSIL